MQLHTSPSLATIERRRSRTGSPSAAKTAARSAASRGSERLVGQGWTARSIDSYCRLAGAHDTILLTSINLSCIVHQSTGINLQEPPWHVYSSLSTFPTSNRRSTSTPSSSVPSRPSGGRATPTSPSPTHRSSWSSSRRRGHAAPGVAGALNHLGVEVETPDEVRQASQRLSGDGLATTDQCETTCCYAVQDKVWVDDPDGSPWEVYTVLADAPGESGVRGDGTCCEDSTTDIAGEPRVATRALCC